MARPLRTITAAVALAALSACTVHKQSEAPALTGPSATGNSLSVKVSPNVLMRDGASQSLVTVTAIGPNGQPLRSVPLRLSVTSDGAITDAMGTLSARNLVTDANGQATATFTAPAPIGGDTTGATIGIEVRPTDASFGNSLTETAVIKLLPPGDIPAPQSPLQPDFTPLTATVGNTTVFQATVVDASGADATALVASYFWNFDDGTTATGRVVNHIFARPGSKSVSLTITDMLGRAKTKSHPVAVDQGQIPTATFVTSPAAPIVNQTINFNGSGSTPEPGHTIRDYAWTFGDGSSGGGAIVQHAYHDPGTYTVTLQVTDDAGRKSALVSQSIVVGADTPTARPSASPNPASGATGTSVQVTFDGSASTAAGGRTIVSYQWTFSNGGTASGPNVFHSFIAGGTYFATLTVTDDAGKTDTKSVTVVVNGT